MSLDDVLDALAREHAPEVLAEAVRQARIRAGAELADRLTKAILAAAAPARTENTKGLCAYAITRNHPLDVDLGADLQPRLVTHRDLAIVVTEVELARFADLGTDPDDVPKEDSPLVVLARQHDVLVRAVFRRQPVLPLRFGTVISDEGAVVRLLRDRHDEASAWLDRVDGCVEWGVRARLAGGEPIAEDTPLDGVSGTEYLAMRQKQLTGLENARRRAATAARTVHDALLPYATDCTSRGNANGLLLDAAYLVPAAEESAFHTEIDRLTRELTEVTLQTTGPWPPYSFTPVELAVDSA